MYERRNGSINPKRPGRWRGCSRGSKEVPEHQEADHADSDPCQCGAERKPLEPALQTDAIDRHRNSIQASSSVPGINHKARPGVILSCSWPPVFPAQILPDDDPGPMHHSRY